MALKLYMDTHIARAVAVQLREKGIDVVRCEDVEMATASDEEHLIYASDNESVMVSQDDDFAVLHAHWQQVGRKHTGIMLLPNHLQGETQISYAVRELLFYCEAEANNALDYETEIVNQIIYL